MSKLSCRNMSKLCALPGEVSMRETCENRNVKRLPEPGQPAFLIGLKKSPYECNPEVKESAVLPYQSSNDVILGVRQTYQARIYK